MQIHNSLNMLKYLKNVRKHLRGTSEIANKSNYKEYCYNTVRDQ